MYEDYENDELQFDDYEVNGKCDNCNHYDEIDQIDEMWTTVDRKTLLCRDCFECYKKRISTSFCGCGFGCDFCLMTSY